MLILCLFYANFMLQNRRTDTGSTQKYSSESHNKNVKTLRGFGLIDDFCDQNY